MRQTLPLLPALVLLLAGGPGLTQEPAPAADSAADPAADESAIEQAAAEPTSDEAGQPLSEEDLIAQAESAGPPAVAQGATIHGFDEGGQMVVLREGT